MVDKALHRLSSTLADIESRVVDDTISPEEQTRLDKATSAMKSAIECHKSLYEIRKLDAEASNLSRGARSEGTRFWVSVIAPLVGSVAIVATLVFQIHQFNENSRLTRLNNEGMQFRELIKATQMPGELAAYTNIALLKTFLKSETYGEQAKIVAVSILSGMVTPEGFRELFSATFPDITYSDLPELVRLSRMQNESTDAAVRGKDQAEELLKQAEQRGTQNQPLQIPPELIKQSPTLTSGMPMTPKMLVGVIQDQLYAMYENAGLTSEGIAVALRKRSSGSAPDLSGIFLWNVNLSGIDFDSAVLTKTSIQNSDISNCDFGAVTHFNDSNWSYTQWWRAKRINHELLEYLKKNYPLDASKSYFGTASTKAEYDRQLDYLSSLK